MPSEKQVLNQIRACILRDLAGARVQLSRINRGVMAHTELQASDVHWIEAAKDQLLKLDEDCRVAWGFRPIRKFNETTGEWE
jgi:hypothetical protein